MIRFGSRADMPEIMEIWKESFGDTREEIAEFFRCLAGCVRVLLYEGEDREENGMILGQLCLIPVKLRYHGKEIRAEYIYAVATKTKARGRGVCTGLLNAAVSLIREEGSCAVLVPADDALAVFYEKRGFRSCFHEQIMQITAFAQEPQTAEASDTVSPPVFVPVTAAAYIEQRRAAFARADCIEEPDAMVNYAVSAFMREDGICVRLTYGRKTCGVLCRIEKQQEENSLFIQEITITDKEEAIRAVQALLPCLDCAHAVLRRSYNTYGMYLPAEMTQNGFFNLVLD